MGTRKLRIALVTGGSRGLGRSTALKLAEQGTDVILTYKGQERAAEERNRLQWGRNQLAAFSTTTHVVYVSQQRFLGGRLSKPCKLGWTSMSGWPIAPESRI